MKALLTLSLIYSFPILGLAQIDPCKSADYLQYRDVPREELFGSKRNKKRKAEKACERYRLEQRGNWKVAKELVVADVSSTLFLDGRKLGISDGQSISGGAGKGFLIGLLVSGISTRITFSSDDRTLMLVSPISSMVLAGLLSKTDGQIPSSQLRALSDKQAIFLFGYKKGFSRAAAKTYGERSVLASLASSALVTAFGFLAYSINEEFSQPK